MNLFEAVHVITSSMQKVKETQNCAMIRITIITTRVHCKNDEKVFSTNEEISREASN